MLIELPVINYFILFYSVCIVFHFLKILQFISQSTGMRSETAFSYYKKKCYYELLYGSLARDELHVDT